jgi:hypothetical protein
LDDDFFAKLLQLGISVPSDLRKYGSEVAALDPFQPGRSHEVRMEEFFKELFWDFEEASDPRSLPARAYSEMVDIYVRVIRQTTNWPCADQRRGSPVGSVAWMEAPWHVESSCAA